MTNRKTIFTTVLLALGSFALLLKEMKTRSTSSCLIALLLTCFGFLPRAQAVITDPEGYFPGWNTAEGQGALFSLTTGQFNTALGGAALYSNTTGNSNTAVGLNALFHNTTSFGNTALGPATLFYNSAGDRNTATGYAALRSNTTGDENTATGYQALYFNTTGDRNTADGDLALNRNTTGSYNTATGFGALYRNTTGILNTALGWEALVTNTANKNTGVGFHALRSNTTGDDNTAVGGATLFDNTTGSENTAVGKGALQNSTTGYGNVAVGFLAGNNVTTAGYVICIGHRVYGANVNNSCYIGNIHGKPGGSQAVYVNEAGKLGQIVSSRRFKDEVKPMEKASEVIYALKPVSFRYKAEIEPSRPLSFGLIAEDVEKIAPNLVTRGSDGNVNSVRYDAVNAMLLNEFLKEHRKVQELKATVAKQEASIAEQRKDFEATNAQQQKQIEALTAGLQKVSAQIETTKVVPSVARNNQ